MCMEKFFQMNKPVCFNIVSNNVCLSRNVDDTLLLSVHIKHDTSSYRIKLKKIFVPNTVVFVVVSP